MLAIILASRVGIDLAFRLVSFRFASTVGNKVSNQLASSKLVTRVGIQLAIWLALGVGNYVGIRRWYKIGILLAIMLTLSVGNYVGIETWQLYWHSEIV